MDGAKERITCYECGANYSLNLAKLPESTESFKCMKCGKPVPILRRLLKPKQPEAPSAVEKVKARPTEDSSPSAHFDPYGEFGSESSEEDTEAGNWLATLADMFSILLIFFIMMFAISSVDRKKFETVVQSINQALGGNIAFPDVPAAKPPAPVLPAPSALENLKNAVRQEKQTFSALKERLEGFISEQHLQDKFVLVEDNDALVLIAQDMVMFDSGSADIKTDVRSQLSRLAVSLKQIKNDIVVEGHTDDVPIHTSRFASNWDLSVMRATSVVHYLIEECGLDPSRLSAAGYSYFRPRYSLSSEERGKNRRIEILIKKKYSDQFINEFVEKKTNGDR